MSEKSHVSLEQRVCCVCGQSYDTGAILIDRRLRASLEKNTKTGWGLCPEHQALFDQGFIALVACDPERSGNPSPGELIKPADAYRTGQIAHLKREAFHRIFNVPVESRRPLVFVEPAVIDKLQGIAKE